MKKIKYNNVNLLFVGKDLNSAPKIERLFSFFSNKASIHAYCILREKSNKLNSYGYKERFRFLSYFKILFLMLKVFFILVFKNDGKSELIYAVNLPAAIIGRFIIIFNKKYTLSYEAFEINVGMTKSIYSGRFRPFWRFIEKWVIDGCGYFIATDQYRLKFLRRYYNIDKNKTYCDYIYNTRDLVKIIEEKKDDNYISACYCGGVMAGRSIDDTIIALNKTLPSLHFNIYGSVDNLYLTEINEKFKSNGINKINFHGRFDNSSVVSILSNEDITFSFYSSVSSNNRLASPNKLFDAMASGILLLTSSFPLVRFLNRKGELSCIIVDNIDDINALSSDFIYSKIRENRERRIEIIKSFNRNYSWEAMERKLEGIFIL
ncbi:glycosyltransferase family protein [Photobacterium sp. GSS17]|uniref:glycosyltransferase family protein n=1 Tax=Photobacterium sp. GSS17 TaxID=3020715 RepID=UPI0023619575|nr:hypothetical protein [Photobacterium sp. GSS17]